MTINSISHDRIRTMMTQDLFPIKLMIHVRNYVCIIMIHVIMERRMIIIIIIIIVQRINRLYV